MKSESDIPSCETLMNEKLSPKKSFWIWEKLCSAIIHLVVYEILECANMEAKDEHQINNNCNRGGTSLCLQ